MSDPNAHRFKLLRIYCEASSVATVGMGCLVLYGWAFHIEMLKTVLPGLVTMKANTALGIAFSGASLWLLLPADSGTKRKTVARFLALLIVMIGTATLAEYVFGTNLGIDQLLFNDPEGSLGTSSPGRLAPTTATAFMALGLALMLLDYKTRRGRRPAQVLSLWAGLIAMVAITGYVYDISIVYNVFLYTKVAVHTALALGLLSSAIFFARPLTGIAGDLTSEGSGSVVARRFLPAVFLVPILLGWICLREEIAGMYGIELGLALYATVNMVVFAVLVWWNALTLNKEYDQRSQAEVEIRQLNDKLESSVAERTRSAELLSERLALATAVAKVGVWEWDLVNETITWDATMFEIYGFPPVFPMLYEKWAAAVHPEDLPAVEAMLRKTRDDKAQGSAEFRIFVSGGSLRNISVIERAVLDEHANVARIIGVNMDITERKQT